MAWYDSLIPSSQVQVQNPYQLQNQGGADAGAYGGIGQLGQYNLGGQNLPWYQQLTQQGVNNPGIGQYMQGAQQAGQMGQQAGMGTFGYGGQVQQQGAGLMPDVQQLLQMGFDPQNALYSRTQQQVADQNAARSAASGVGGTPYGQGVANQSNSNFNIDWQNNQLQRAAQGAGAAGQLYGQATGGIEAGANLQNAGLSQFMSGAGLPYNVGQGINQQQRQTLSDASAYGQGAAAIPQMQIQDYMAYLNQANQNAQTKNQSTGLELQKAKDEFGQAESIGKDIGGALGFGFGGFPGMGGGFGGMQGGGGYGMGFGGGQPFGGGWGGGSGGNMFGGGGWGGGGGGWNPFGGGGGQFGGYKPSAPYYPNYQGYQG